MDTKEPGQEPEVICLPKGLGPRDLLQGVDLFVLGLCKGGTGVDAFATAGAGFHFHHLPQGKVRQIHLPDAPHGYSPLTPPFGARGFCG
jgi:hypothetical protein